MAVDWNILSQYPDAGQAFNQAFQQGQQQNMERGKREAMSALVQNPNDPKALAALARLDPATAMQFRQQQAELSKAQLAQHQDNILKGAEILRQFNPKDQQSYSQALSQAQQLGVDLTGVPQEYNPQYVDGVIHLADALKPQTNNDVANIPYQAGGGVLQYDRRTGAVSQLVAPNPDGAHPAGAPVSSGVTATGPNGEKIHYNAQSGQWEPLGGPTQPASGGFPSSYSDVGPYHRY